jgi:hypothetical protein
VKNIQFSWKQKSIWSKQLHTLPCTHDNNEENNPLQKPDGSSDQHFSPEVIIFLFCRMNSSPNETLTLSHACYFWTCFTLYKRSNCYPHFFKNITRALNMIFVLVILCHSGKKRRYLYGKKAHSWTLSKLREMMTFGWIVN